MKIQGNLTSFVVVLLLATGTVNANQAKVDTSKVSPSNTSYNSQIITNIKVDKADHNIKPGITVEIRAMENFDAIAALGDRIFNDTNLSIPSGVACASCHSAATGYDEPDTQYPTSQGSLGDETFGKRNSPTVAYAAFIPDPQIAYIPNINNPEPGGHTALVGGQFWDGRAKNLAEQAKLPFLDPLEMNHKDAESVVNAVRSSDYSAEFIRVFGENAFDNPDKAFDNIATAIAAFEMTPVFSPFNSKYDAVKRGEDKFTAQEARGEKLFHDKAQCARCHFTPESFGPQVFSNHQYFNIGTPRNLNSEFQKQNPAFWDKGRGRVTRRGNEVGAFKTPTLRNVELTAPYLHNGTFKTLKDVVKFYSDGGVSPEYAPTVTDDGFYNTGVTLNDDDVDDIVAFLKTLTDRNMVAKK